MSKRRTTRRAPRRIQRLATPEERAYVATFSRDHSSVWRFGGWLFGILGLSIAVLLLSVDLPYWMPAVALLTGAAISWLSFRAAKTLASPDSDEDVHVVELKGPLEILDVRIGNHHQTSYCIDGVSLQFPSHWLSHLKDGAPTAVEVAEVPSPGLTLGLPVISLNQERRIHSEVKLGLLQIRRNMALGVGIMAVVVGSTASLVTMSRHEATTMVWAVRTAFSPELHFPSLGALLKAPSVKEGMVVHVDGAASMHAGQNVFLVDKTKLHDVAAEAERRADRVQSREDDDTLSALRSLRSHPGAMHVYSRQLAKLPEFESFKKAVDADGPRFSSVFSRGISSFEAAQNYADLMTARIEVAFEGYLEPAVQRLEEQQRQAQREREAWYEHALPQLPHLRVRSSVGALWPNAHALEELARPLPPASVVVTSRQGPVMNVEHVFSLPRFATGGFVFGLATLVCGMFLVQRGFVTRRGNMKILSRICEAYENAAAR